MVKGRGIQGESKQVVEEGVDVDVKEKWGAGTSLEETVANRDMGGRSRGGSDRGSGGGIETVDGIERGRRKAIGSKAGEEGTVWDRVVSFTEVKFAQVERTTKGVGLKAQGVKGEHMIDGIVTWEERVLRRVERGPRKDMGKKATK
jgi:hypothetical protein